MQKTVTAIAGCLAFVMVIAVPVAVSSSAEAAAPCLPTDVSVSGAVPASFALDAEQRANAQAVVGAVVSRRMPTRAAVLAISAALAHSSLRNPGTDRDLFGLPHESAVWGSAEALASLDPVRSTDRFLDRLKKVQAWPVMPLSAAVQAVRKDTAAVNYERWELTATRVVNALLGRPEPTSADEGGDVPDLGSVGAPAPLDGATAPATPGCDDEYAGYSSVPVADCEFLLPRQNPRTCQNAVRWALAQVDGPAVWRRRCLNFVAQTYGYDHSGVENAALFWATVPVRHPPEAAPPAGALVFWDTGKPEGHVALSAGDGIVVSNDIQGPGTIAAVRLSDLTSRWNARYLGWSPPFFAHGI